VKQYHHIYGGMATDLGPYSKDEVERWLKSQGITARLPVWGRREGKLLDLVNYRREVIVYGEDNGEYTITVINR